MIILEQDKCVVLAKDDITMQTLTLVVKLVDTGLKNYVQGLRHRINYLSEVKKLDTDSFLKYDCPGLLA